MNDGNGEPIPHPERTSAAGRVKSWPDTHGRWPWVAAGGALPASVAVLIKRDRLLRNGNWAFWLAGPALLWHQTEEWVWPGGFLPWFNRDVLGGSDEFPITRRDGLRINVGLGWGVSLASSLAGRRAAALATLNLGLMAGNVAVHVGQAVDQRRYNPGLVTATGVFTPLVALAAVRLWRDPAVGPGRTAAGTAAGLIASAGVFAVMRRRARMGPLPPDPRG